VGLAAKTAVVAALWLSMARALPQLAWHALPQAWLDQLSLPTYSMLCQVLSTACGLGAAALLLPRPTVAVGLVPCSWRAWGVALLLAPAIFVITSRVALTIAEPYLIAELATQGEGASRRNAGDFGRAVTQAPLVLTVLWGIALAAVTEELLFRGILMTALQRLGSLLLLSATARPVNAGSPAVALVRARAERAAGAAAVVVSTMVFAAMHADMRGSVGVVRVVATACLGLACGVARLLSGSVLAGVALHLVYNTVSIGLGRSWFGPRADTLVPAVPDPLLALAVIGVVAAGIALAIRRRRGSAEV